MKKKGLLISLTLLLIVVTVGITYFNNRNNNKQMCSDKRYCIEVGSYALVFVADEYSLINFYSQEGEYSHSIAISQEVEDLRISDDYNEFPKLPNIYLKENDEYYKISEFNEFVIDKDKMRFSKVEKTDSSFESYQKESNRIDTVGNNILPRFIDQEFEYNGNTLRMSFFDQYIQYDIKSQED